MFPVGHNGTAAWGNTAGLLDNTDLFIEEIGSDGKSVRVGDAFVPCECRKEVILVKGGDPVEEDVLITPRGPIIGPALDGEVGAISLRATWLDIRPLRGLSEVHRARSYDEFRRGFEQWPALSLNMVYADTSGTVGWQLVGEVPRRKKGWGTIPLSGSDPEVGWRDDPIPFDEMPHVKNPENGFVATANNRPTVGERGPFLGEDWVDGYRVARIVEELGARSNWDLSSTQALQMDQKSLPWRELRGIILDIPAQTDDARRALDLMRNWDGVVAAESPASAMFEVFLVEMTKRMVQARAPRAAPWALGKGFTPLVPHSLLSVRRVNQLVRLTREQPMGWFERTWPEEMADALSTAARSLRERYGNEPSRWAWGRIRPLTLRHPMGGRKPLGRVFNLGPFAWGGDANTVAQASVDPITATGNPLFIASLRMVVDVGNWNEAKFAMPGGQSGNPLSPHYRDLLPLWQRGEGAPIAWSPANVDKATQSTLRLVPI
jgi:penicillin amidase